MAGGSLDLIICTYNRSGLLRRAIESVLRAPVPDGLVLTVTIVDNNSSDDTRTVVQEYVAATAAARPGLISYRFEPQQGLSHARNAGILAGRADWVGMIDDDEELHPEWLARAATEMRRPEADFFAGPYHLAPEVRVPAWALRHRECRGPLGFFDHADHDFEFTRDDPRLSLGGNIVIRRAVLDRVGLYDTGLGRVGVGFAGSEDEDMHLRLIAAGARGFYLHQLIIHHHCPPERQTRRYHRRWFFGVGYSQGKMSRKAATDVVYLWRFPRYLVLPTLRHLIGAPFSFRSELLLRGKLGYLWGCWQVPTLGPVRSAAPFAGAASRDDAQDRLGASGG